ncbi:MAG: fumarate hydratase [Oligosphaeraceae bacterium]|nr:fumarate hydratase [Oligosphaeraceae bacterium]
MSLLSEQLLALIARTSVDLPAEVEAALTAALQRESPDSSAAAALQTMLENAALARRNRLPICQDTGMLQFYVEAAADFPAQAFRTAAEAAVSQATALGLLRQNCVDTLSGKNTGNNLGPGCPQIHWEENGREHGSRVTLLLKGGGSENMSRQYSLPDEELKAGRDLSGVRRCVLDAVWRAQGQGCSPGILGVAIGGDRCSGYELSKRQLLRKIGERSPVPELSALELSLQSDLNRLGIGPMGFGGRTTVLEVFVAACCRIPASYFVTVAYMCWCCRRQSMEIV